MDLLYSWLRDPDMEYMGLTLNQKTSVSKIRECRGMYMILKCKKVQWKD